nr:hypothetical protein [Kutzneria chonburiensis]
MLTFLASIITSVIAGPSPSLHSGGNGSVHEEIDDLRHERLRFLLLIPARPRCLHPRHEGQAHQIARCPVRRQPQLLLARRQQRRDCRGRPFELTQHRRLSLPARPIVLLVVVLVRPVAGGSQRVHQRSQPGRHVVDHRHRFDQPTRQRLVSRDRVDPRNQLSCPERSQDAEVQQLLLVLEDTEDRALGDPRRLRDLPGGDVRAVLGQQGNRRKGDGLLPVLRAHRRSTPTARG